MKDSTTNPGRYLVIGSDDILHIIYLETNDTLYYENSNNYGITWANRIRISNSSWKITNMFCMVIDSTNKLYVFYSYSDGGFEDDAVIRTSVDNGVSWTAESALISDPAGCNGMSATVDNDDDVTFVASFAKGTAHTIKAVRWTGASWSSIVTLVSSGTSSMNNPECAAISNDSVFVVYRTWVSDEQDLKYVWCDSSMVASGTDFIYNATDTNYDVIDSSVVSFLDNNIYIVYVRENGTNNIHGLYYKKYNTTTNTFNSEESIYYDATYPVLSCSASWTLEGDFNVLFSKHNAIATTDKIHKCTKAWGGSWGEVCMFNIGNDNETEYPSSAYQCFPSNNILTQGILFAFFNDSTDNICYADNSMHSWYNGSDYFYEDSPWNISGGTGYGYHITLNVYNESNTSEGLVFNVFVTNLSGSETYYDISCINPHNIYLNQIPLGDDICFLISSNGYYSRQFYMDIDSNSNYEFTVYLAPLSANLYSLNVVGPPNDIYENPPIENVKVSIKQYINTTGKYENITILYTDVNGQCEVYLLSNVLYKVILEKMGYITSTNDYIPSPTVFTYTFRMYYNDSDVNYTSPYFCNEELLFNGYINRGTAKLYLNYTDGLAHTINTKIITYEYRSNFSNETVFNTNSKTGNSSYQINFTINNSRSYRCVLYLNHSDCGYMILQLYFNANRSTITTPEKFDLLFTANYGSNPFGWSNTIMWLIMVSCLFSFGRRETYMSTILCGFVFLFINYSIGFYTAMSVGVGIGIPLLFIVMGVLMIYRDRGMMG